jgi:hypothetical protein
MSKANQINIREFYNNLKKNPLRYKHQFTLEIQGDSDFLNKISLGNSTNIDNCITYWGKSTSIPETTVTEAKVDFFGNGFVVPGIVQYPEDWKVTLILDEDLTIYEKIKQWSDYISNLGLNGGSIEQDGKTIKNVKGKVNLLDETMTKVTETFCIEGIWPKEVGEIKFNYKEGASEIKTFDVTFAMQYFYAESDKDPLDPNTKISGN